MTVDSLDTRPFDRSELQKCHQCGRGIMHSGAIHFYEVSVGQCVVDLASVRQQTGTRTRSTGVRQVHDWR